MLEFIPIIIFAFITLLLFVTTIVKTISVSQDRSTYFFFPIFAYLILFNVRNIKIKKILTFILCFVEILELVSIKTTGKTFNDQFIENALDIPSAFYDLPFWFALIIVAIVFLVVVFSFNNFIFRLTFSLFFFSMLFFFVFSLKKALIISRAFLPVSIDPYKTPDAQFFKDLSRYYYSDLTFKAPSKKKNLFVLILESFELENLGTYNKKLPNLMPYLSSLAKNTTIFDHIETQPYTTESIASTLCTFCGFPYVKRRCKFHRNRQFRCFHDFLSKAGYNNYMVGTFKYRNDNIFDFFRKRGYKVFDRTDHKQQNDQDTFKWIESTFFKFLEAHQPFNFVQYTTNTHWGKYLLLCPKEYHKYKEIYYNEFECVDLSLKRLFTAFSKTSFYNSTEIIIYGDHSRTYRVHEPSQSIILPKHKWGNLSWKINYYDFSHLVFHLLNISIEPFFIYGDDPFSPNYQFKVPTPEQATYLTNSFNAKIYF